MIGVLANPADEPIIAEFFQLFKTPWEYARKERAYDILICAGVAAEGFRAKLRVIYGGVELAGDGAAGRRVTGLGGGVVLESGRGAMPIYGPCVGLAGAGRQLLAVVGKPGQSAGLQGAAAEGSEVRLGYDLFGEVRHLLTRGQPTEHAGAPVLDLHIALLRDLIIAGGLPLVEIPPVPSGHDFITCLTHDVDHVGIRNHRFDHTMLGFLYRATAGTVAGVFRGRMAPRALVDNFLAVLRLPFIHAGLARDFWYQFDHYIELERGVVSTFFVVPRKNDPGTAPKGGVEPARAIKYGLEDILPDLARVQAAGDEVGVHGIDAWRDSDRGREERERVAPLTKRPGMGIRMHWLYFAEHSPKTLEDAGFAYDSTVGYNETIGYRAGTSQVFRPPGVSRLLELPMQVMDTALFYPCYRNLSPRAARAAVQVIVEQVTRLGGALTINWHDRSIAPERWWDGFYRDLIADLKRRGAWFATAGDAVTWFAQRRAATLEEVPAADGSRRVRVVGNAPAGMPGMRLRVHRGTTAPAAAEEISLSQNFALEIAI